MRLISDKSLRDFADQHPEAREPLWFWRSVIRRGSFWGFADLKKSFNTIDKVGDCYVFDIGGNKFRVVAAIHFNTQILYVRFVYTHKEYDKWKP